MIHELKILPQYFIPVFKGEKTFEIRKNDRGYKAGDTLKLMEWTPTDGYTGNEVRKKVSYVFEGKGEIGLSEGYCVLGLKPTDDYEDDLK